VGAVRYDNNALRSYLGHLCLANDVSKNAVRSQLNLDVTVVQGLRLFGQEHSLQFEKPGLTRAYFFAPTR
jgi:hypothetical protein